MTSSDTSILSPSQPSLQEVTPPANTQKNAEAIKIILQVALPIIFTLLTYTISTSLAIALLKNHSYQILTSILPTALVALSSTTTSLSTAIFSSIKTKKEQDQTSPSNQNLFSFDDFFTLSSIEAEATSTSAEYSSRENNDRSKENDFNLKRLEEEDNTDEIEMRFSEELQHHYSPPLTARNEEDTLNLLEPQQTIEIPSDENSHIINEQERREQESQKNRRKKAAKRRTNQFLQILLSGSATENTEEHLARFNEILKVLGNDRCENFQIHFSRKILKNQKLREIFTALPKTHNTLTKMTQIIEELLNNFVNLETYLIKASVRRIISFVIALFLRDGRAKFSNVFRRKKNRAVTLNDLFLKRDPQHLTIISGLHIYTTIELMIRYKKNTLRRLLKNSQNTVALRNLFNNTKIPPAASFREYNTDKLKNELLLFLPFLAQRLQVNCEDLFTSFTVGMQTNKWFDFFHYLILNANPINDPTFLPINIHEDLDLCTNIPTVPPPAPTPTNASNGDSRNRKTGRTRRRQRRPEDHQHNRRATHLQDEEEEKISTHTSSDNLQDTLPDLPESVNFYTNTRVRNQSQGPREHQIQLPPEVTNQPHHNPTAAQVSQQRASAVTTADSSPQALDQTEEHGSSSSISTSLPTIPASQTATTSPSASATPSAEQEEQPPPSAAASAAEVVVENPGEEAPAVFSIEAIRTASEEEIVELTEVINGLNDFSPITKYTPQNIINKSQVVPKISVNMNPLKIIYLIASNSNLKRIVLSWISGRFSSTSLTKTFKKRLFFGGPNGLTTHVTYFKHRVTAINVISQIQQQEEFSEDQLEGVEGNIRNLVNLNQLNRASLQQFLRNYLQIPEQRVTTILGYIYLRNSDSLKRRPDFSKFIFEAIKHSEDQPQ